MDELNDAFMAWATQVANRRIHAETAQSPEARFAIGAPHRGADPTRLVEAFRWSAQRKVTRTAMVSLEGNSYCVDAALVGRRVELRFDPENLSAIDVFVEGRPAGVATPFLIGRHTHKAVPQAARPAPPPTGVDYLGLVQTAHDAETVGTISYAQVPLPGANDEVGP
ncbi:MAG: Mu transposase C-terminal domain-containing protein [Acidimicrobiales bacterium]